jgi:TonB family protein
MAAIEHKSARHPSRRSVDAQRRPVSVIPKKRQPIPSWIIALAAGAVIAVILWWHWNRGWQELEAPLKEERAASVQKPQVQVPAEVMEKLLVHRVEPVYPAEARKSKLEGTIALEIVVGRDGSVVNMRALNGPDVLARAAMDALRWWKFEPYRLNGEPVVAATTVAVEFKR